LIYVALAMMNDRETPQGRVDRASPGRKWWAIVRSTGSGNLPSRAVLFGYYACARRCFCASMGGRERCANVTKTACTAPIGVVPQDNSVLFNDTIGYNIAYGQQIMPPRRHRGRRRDHAQITTYPALTLVTPPWRTRLKLAGGEKSEAWHRRGPC